jgi:hypothetical protein
MRTGAAARFAGSNTSTVFACEHETKARFGVPAKTTSHGSSSVASVATHVARARGRRLLTESEMWFTTQASVLVRARTETGSRPTGIDAMRHRLSAREARTPRGGRRAC